MEAVNWTKQCDRKAGKAENGGGDRLNSFCLPALGATHTRPSPQGQYIWQKCSSFGAKNDEFAADTFHFTGLINLL